MVTALMRTVPQGQWRVGVPQIDSVRQLAFYRTPVPRRGTALDNRTVFIEAQHADGTTTWSAPALVFELPEMEKMDVYLHCPSRDDSRGPVVHHPGHGAQYRLVPTSVLGGVTAVPTGYAAPPDWLYVPTDMSERNLRSCQWTKVGREWLQSRLLVRRAFSAQIYGRVQGYAYEHDGTETGPVLFVQPYFHGLLMHAGAESADNLPVTHWIGTLATLHQSLEAAINATTPHVQLAELARALARQHAYLQAAVVLNSAAHFVLLHKDRLGLPEMCRQLETLGALKTSYLQLGGNVFAGVTAERAQRITMHGWRKLAGLMPPAAEQLTLALL